jgi:hypothetical protein
MILFATSIVDPEAYRRYARPGIEACVEPGAEIAAYLAIGNVCRSANLLLDLAADRDDLEALVLVDQDVEIRDPGFCAKVRDALRDPSVAVVGWMGASDVRGIAWWEGRVSCGPVVRRFHQHGGGELSPFAWRRVDAPPRDVDMVDGRLMALSPWAVRAVRFDETLSLGHGYDLDYCLRVRDAGRRVVTADIRAVHHHSLALVPFRDRWIEGHIRVAQKWDERLGGAAPPIDWKQRARRAEAERDAARTVAYSSMSRVDALVAPLERQLADMTGSVGWRLTAPLRALNRRRKRA